MAEREKREGDEYDTEDLRRVHVVDSSYIGVLLFLFTFSFLLF